MPFSHHSHSGEFCSHATDTLEDMVQRAIDLGFSTFCLTEHMPREPCDLYPGEVEESKSWLDLSNVADPVEFQTSRHLQRVFATFYGKARQLQNVYAGQIRLPVGVEIDWIRPSSETWIRDLLKQYPLDLLVGSVHHVHEIPIDFDRTLYEAAREKSGGTEASLFAAYFDLQFDMLQRLKPPLIGHFDLIRLKSDGPNLCIRDLDAEVWTKVLRNLDLIKAYGAVVEINSAALRKGLREVYPQAAICQARGIPIALSDDSHGLDQIGACYPDALAYCEHLGLTEMLQFGLGPSLHNPLFPDLSALSVRIADLQHTARASGGALPSHQSLTANPGSIKDKSNKHGYPLGIEEQLLEAATK